jgi:glycosyltransferase involved in cell wall biosynthesis
LTAFSILTPSFGYGRFIADAVESVRRQATSASVEHVIADGGSTDETCDVLRRYEGLVWSSGPDDGQSDALNKALAVSTGDTIGWLNADEFYLEGALDAVHRCFVESDADVVYGDSIFIDVDAHLLRAVPQHPLSRSVLRHYGCYIASCAFFVRRDALPADPWDTRLSNLMDWDLYLKLASDGRRFEYLPRALGAFRVHDERVTAERLPKHDPERLRVRQRHGITNRTGPREGLALFGRAAHMGRKLLAGSYGRQLRARQHRSQDQRWWALPEDGRRGRPWDV